MGLSETLIQMQKERGETNYMLAKALGVHQSTVKNWQNGAKPQQAHIQLLEKHYGKPYSEMISSGE